MHAIPGAGDWISTPGAAISALGSGRQIYAMRANELKVSPLFRTPFEQYLIQVDIVFLCGYCLFLHNART
jgi:hypothetical protein